MGIGWFLTFFGLIFFSAGGLVMWIGIAKPPGTVTENAGIAIVFGLIFAMVGLATMAAGIYDLWKHYKAKKDGAHYRAKIWRFDKDYSVRINGHPAVKLIVRFFDGQGQLREEEVKTGSTNTSRYPLGGSIMVSEYKDIIYLVDKRAEMVRLEREEELMNPAAVPVSKSIYITGMTAAGTFAGEEALGGFVPGMGAVPMTSGPAVNAAASAGVMSVACPACGAVTMILPGTTVVCKCGRQFTLTQDHMIV